MTDWKQTAHELIRSEWKRAEKAFRSVRGLPGIRFPAWLDSLDGTVYVENSPRQTANCEPHDWYLAIRPYRDPGLGYLRPGVNALLARVRYPADATRIVDHLRRIQRWCTDRIAGDDRHLAVVTREQSRHVQRIAREGAAQQIQEIP